MKTLTFRSSLEEVPELSFREFTVKNVDSISFAGDKILIFSNAGIRFTVIFANPVETGLAYKTLNDWFKSRNETDNFFELTVNGYGDIWR